MYNLKMNVRHCISKIYESLNCLLIFRVFLINFEQSENYKNYNIKPIKFHKNTDYNEFNLLTEF